MDDSSKVFDRLIILLCLIGVLVRATALVVAIKGMFGMVTAVIVEA